MPAQTSISYFSENKRLPDSELCIYCSKYNEQIGELILMVEICGAKENTKKIINHIVEDTEYHYFNSIAKHAEKALEDALQKVNFAVSETIKHTKKEWLARSSVLIIAHCGNEVHFTQIGKINAFLISEKEASQIIDPTEENAINPVKPFGNIYSGAMPDNSALLFVTSSILDYISQEKLRKICKEQPTEMASKHIKELLKKAPKTKHFGAVIVKRQNEETGKKQLEETFIKEEVYSSGGDAVPLESIEKKKDVKEKPIHKSNAANDKQDASDVGFQKNEEKQIINDLNPKTNQSKITKNYSQPMQKNKPKNNRNAMINKIIILTLGILVVWFGINLFTNGKKQKTEIVETDKTPTEYQTLLNAIQAQFIEAQNYLIVDKRDEALLALQEIQKRIDEIPEITEDQRNVKKEFSRKISTQLLLAQGVNLLVPKLITETGDISTEQIILKDSKIYTVDTANNTIFSLPLAEKTLAKVMAAAEAVGSIQKIIDHTAGSIIFYHSLDGLAEFDVSKNGLKSIEWQRTGTGAPQAGDIYQNKLYIITPSNTILKYTRSITGYTQETKWLNEPQDTVLANTVDMAVDGAIWTLSSNGAIAKFFKGVRENFTATIAPPLKKPARLFTDLDLKYLYILDTGTNRVVILNKDTGAIATQFTAQEFAGLKDFAVNESVRTIYLLDKNGIFEVKF